MARPSAIELASQIAQSVKSPEVNIAPAQSIHQAAPAHEISYGQGLGLGL
jgi:hypothetical protein